MRFLLALTSSTLRCKTGSASLLSSRRFPAKRFRTSGRRPIDLRASSKQLRADSERIDMEIGRLGSELKTVDSESTHRLAQLQSQLRGDCPAGTAGQVAWCHRAPVPRKARGCAERPSTNVWNGKNPSSREPCMKSATSREQAPFPAHSQAEERERALATTISDLRTTISASESAPTKTHRLGSWGLFARQLAGFVPGGPHRSLEIVR